MDSILNQLFNTGDVIAKESKNPIESSIEKILEFVRHAASIVGFDTSNIVQNLVSFQAHFQEAEHRYITDL